MTTLESHPELSEHSDGMPVTVPNAQGPEVNTRNVDGYDDSRASLVEICVRARAPGALK